MGCFYSCFKAPAVGEYAPPNNSNSRNCNIIKKSLTKFGSLFASNELRITPSQRKLSLNPTPNGAQKNARKDSSSNGNSRNSRVMDEFMNREDEEVINSGEIICPTSEEEDVCPISFEEFTPENPKIETKCCHAYHLSCIYEWKLRSEKCPTCEKVLEVESLTFY